MEVEPSTWHSSRDTHPSIDPAYWRLTSQPCLCSNHHSTWAHCVVSYYRAHHSNAVQQALISVECMQNRPDGWFNNTPFVNFGTVKIGLVTPPPPPPPPPPPHTHTHTHTHTHSWSYCNIYSIDDAVVKRVLLWFTIYNGCVRGTRNTERHMHFMFQGSKGK